MGIRLGLCQMRVTPDKQENLRRAESCLRQAAAQGANWPCCRRCSTVPMRMPASGLRGARRRRDLAISFRHGPGAGDLPGGRSVPEIEGEAIYNTCYLFSPQGEELARHRKVHLFDIDVPGGQRFMESDTLTAGSQITVVDTALGKLGLAICFDIRFAEFFRVMGDLGAQLILVPAAFNMTTGPLHWDLAFRMRALDQQCFVAGCSPARDRSASYVAYGHSLVCNPGGRSSRTVARGRRSGWWTLTWGTWPATGPRFPFSLAAGPICTARSNKHNGPVGAPQTKKGMLPCIITVIKIMPPVSLESWCWRWR
mgnify:CR=1 FL=1